MDLESSQSSMSSEAFGGLSHLDSFHRAALSQALKNTLDTDLALNHYAQLIDGLPTASTARDRRFRRAHRLHPIHKHLNICPGSLEAAREFRDKFSGNDLTLKIELLKSFNAAPFPSQSFELRLIELVASSLHQIAVFLFQQSDKLHRAETTEGLDVQAVTKWELLEEGWHRVEPWPTLFAHIGFIAETQYPNGAADMAGYWIEDRVLGGVAIFDRSQVWGLHNEPNAYSQSCRDHINYRPWQLLDNQQSRLARFFLDEAPNTASCPLPILPSSENKVRVDQGDAIPVHRIYRDLWERAPPKPRPLGRRRPEIPLDYPEAEDVNETLKKLNQTEKRG